MQTASYAAKALPESLRRPRAALLYAASAENLLLRARPAWAPLYSRASQSTKRANEQVTLHTHGCSLALVRRAVLKKTCFSKAKGCATHRPPLGTPAHATRISGECSACTALRCADGDAGGGRGG
eukprot:6194153-Pleurochrysis_carterae.AAC.12